MAGEAWILNLCKVGNDGRSAYERRKGKRFLRTLSEFWECVWHLKPQSLGKEKLESRLESGVFAGVTEKSGEIHVMSEEGAIKVRGYLRKPEEERWNQQWRTWRPLGSSARKKSHRRQGQVEKSKKK